MSGEGSAAELRALMDAAVDGIVTIDERGCIISVNRAAEALFGYPADELIGRAVEMLMPSPHDRGHSEYIEHYLQTGEKRIIGVGREVVALRKDGTECPVWLSVGEAVTDGGRRFVGILRDLTEQRAAEQEQRNLEARLAEVGRFSLMGEMAAGIAHEINQPLSAIATYAQAGKRLLDAADLQRDSLKESCEKISVQAHRAGEVIENVRRFIRKQDISKESVDINRAIEDVMGLILADTKAANIQLEVDFADDAPHIQANVVQLQQVVLNLTRNAVDALRSSMKKDKLIVIRTRKTDNSHISIVVEDNGPGVSKSLKESIFHPFVTTKRDGLGVGLAISRTIVEAHDGRLQYRPKPGGGSVFYFDLPLGK